MIATIFTTMPMYVCLFWSIQLAFGLHEDKPHRPRLHLLVFMLTATVLYLGHCMFFNHSMGFIPLTDTLYSIANLAVFPLYYLYICSLTIRNELYKERWVILIPAIVGGIAVGALYLMMSPEETNQFVELYLYKGQRYGLQGMAMKQAFAHDICKILFAVLIVPVFFHGRTHIKDYDQLVNNVYADTENKSLSTIHSTLIAFSVTALLSFTANIMGRHWFVDSLWLLIIPSTLFSVLLFTIGYVGYRQQFSIADVEEDEQQADAFTEDPANISELRQRIEQLIEQEQLFKKPNFKIVDLVKLLGTNRSYVYQALNREMGISFSEYINRMRIEHAVKLIDQHPDKPLSEVAEQSGFTSNSSFYRNFKQYRGMGPKEYLNQIKNEE